MDSSRKAANTESRKSKMVLLAIVYVVVIFGVFLLVQSLPRSGVSLSESTISQIISEPACWENKIVKVEGIVENISVGIIQPFNYWLSDKQNQTIRIGLRWYSNVSLSGRSVTVVGVVKRGYAWVHPDYAGWWTYYIEAVSIANIDKFVHCS
jgi:hypothetical protein